MRWFAGSDHAGLELKRALIAELQTLGDTVEDLGVYDAASADYPQYGELVARAVVAANSAASEPTFGLVVCGSGIGISIAANKVAGARCALVHDSFTAAAARAHNDANVIAFGQRVVGVGVALAALQAFRSTTFEGGRHAKRVAKLDAIAAKVSR